MPKTTHTSDWHHQDRTLVERCVRGDRTAWDAFVDRYARLVYSVLRKSGLPADACDDVFQDVFAIVLRQLPTLKDPATLPRWLMTIATREALRARRHHRHTLHDPPGTVAPLPDADLEALEERQRVRDGLRDLGEPCRSLLEALFSSHAHDYTLVAQRLRIPVGSIGPMRARCLKRLQVFLEGRIRRPQPGSVSAARDGASSGEGDVP